MKILVPRASVPLWGEILGYVLMSLASLLFVIINYYTCVVMFVFLNGIFWLAIKAARNIDKWKKNTLEKDAFFQENNFNLASYSKYSMLAVSNTIIRIVNVTSIVQIRERNKQSQLYKPALSRQLVQFKSYDISEVYPNYPSHGNDLTLNGKAVYYIDLPVLEIKSVQAILQGDVTELGFLRTSVKDSSNFGIRITTKQEVIYDVDTPFSKEFCEEINNLMLLPIK
jgi:hypothetical protein